MHVGVWVCGRMGELACVRNWLPDWLAWVDPEKVFLDFTLLNAYLPRADAAAAAASLPLPPARKPNHVSKQLEMFISVLVRSRAYSLTHSWLVGWLVGAYAENGWLAGCRHAKERKKQSYYFRIIS